MNNDDYNEMMDKIREIRRRMVVTKKLMNSRNQMDLDRLRRYSAQIEALRHRKRGG
jgi:hypothetical protein